MEKLVSIITPCYNSAQYIDKYFSSLKEQTIGIGKLEILCINDNSTDNTLDKLYEYEEQFPDSVCVINLKENIKQGGARNVGLEYATGKYIAFVDSDDWIKEDMCAILYHIAEKYQTDFIQFPFIHFFSQDNQVTETSPLYGFLDGNDSEIKRHMLIGNIVTFGSQNKFYKASIIKENSARFIEHRVYEEPYFVYPILVKALNIYIMKEGLYYYRHEHPSVTGLYMSQPGKLYDHPEVQLELLKCLTKQKDVIKNYYNEIEYYFIFTYYVETLYFAGYKQFYLGLDYFTRMQELIPKLFPRYYENVYLNQALYSNVKEILMSLKEKFSQAELKEYCDKVVQIMDKECG